MRSQARAYRSVALQSATPEHLLNELFVRFDRDCADAVEYLQRGEIANRGRVVGHAVQIVSALASALDHDRAPGDVARNLSHLYEFVTRSLLQANLAADAEPLHAVRGVMHELHLGFSGVTDPVAQAG